MRTAVLAALSTTALVALCAHPRTPAFAQTGGGTGSAGTMLTITNIEDPDGKVRSGTDVNTGLNIANCEAPAQTEITFRAAASPMNGGFDLWVSNNTDCSAESARVGTSQTCFNVGFIPMLEANMLFSLTLEELIVPDRVDPCSASATSNLNLFAYDVSQPNFTGNVSSSPLETAAIRVDPARPASPRITRPSGSMASGGSAVSIGWDPITDQDGNQIFYKAFLLGTGASCAELSPTSGGDGGTAAANTIPADAIQLGNDTQAGATSTTVNPSSFGVPVGGAGLVTVVAVDFAKNEGTFSDTKCIVFVETAGFCDVYGTMGGDCDAGGCSVSMPGQGAGRAAPLGLLALGLIVAAARRRRFGA